MDSCGGKDVMGRVQLITTVRVIRSDMPVILSTGYGHTLDKEAVEASLIPGPCLGCRTSYVCILPGVKHHCRHRSIRLQPVEPSGEEFANRRSTLKALKENLHHGGERNG